MGAVDTTEWACVLCGHFIQNAWASKVTNLHLILHQTWTFLHRNYSGDSEGCSYGQLVIDSFFTTMCQLMYQVSYRVFWQNIKSPRWLSPTTAQIFGALWFLAFPKTKITFEREEISHCQWDSRKYYRAIGRNVWGSKVPTLKGTAISLSFIQCFLYLASSSINVSIFHGAQLDTFWTDLVYL